MTNAFVWAGESCLETIAQFAADSGFDFLEVGPGIELSAERFREAAKVVDIDAMIYCRNFIDDDPGTAEGCRRELIRREADHLFDRDQPQTVPAGQRRMRPAAQSCSGSGIPGKNGAPRGAARAAGLS